MTKKEMIDKIYEVVADKTLSFGCITMNKSGQLELVGGEIENDLNQKHYFTLKHVTRGDMYSANINGNKVIGHPVMIGDILDWMLNNTGRGSDDGFSDPESQQSFAMSEICIKWDLYREPIEDQPEECIKFIYELVSS